jgi:hypothetical protein
VSASCPQRCSGREHDRKRIRRRDASIAIAFAASVGSDEFTRGAEAATIARCSSVIRDAPFRSLAGRGASRVVGAAVSTIPQDILVTRREGRVSGSR